MRAAALGLVLLSAGPARAAETAVSLWRAGELTLRLETRGDGRQFVVEDIPHALGRRMGIAPGAILWQGQRRGETLDGEAFRYDAGCPPLPYAMTGSARIAAGGTITLRGQRPQRARGDCAVQAETAGETIVLEYLGHAAPAEGDD